MAASDPAQPDATQSPLTPQFRAPVSPDVIIGDRFDRDDGSTYQRIDPAEFDSFDDVDSTTVESSGSDPGDPDDGPT